MLKYNLLILHKHTDCSAVLEGNFQCIVRPRTVQITNGESLVREDACETGVKQGKDNGYQSDSDI